MTTALIIPKKYANILFISSNQFLCISYYAYLNEQYLFLCFSLWIYFTSLMFWSKPVYGIRRHLDIYSVFSIGAYIMYRSYLNYYVYTCILCMVMLHIKSFRYCYIKNFKKSTICHVLIHNFGTIGTIMAIRYIRSWEEKKIEIKEIMEYHTNQ